MRVISWPSACSAVRSSSVKCQTRRGCRDRAWLARVDRLVASLVLRWPNHGSPFFSRGLDVTVGAEPSRSPRCASADRACPAREAKLDLAARPALQESRASRSSANRRRAPGGCRPSPRASARQSSRQSPSAAAIIGHGGRYPLDQEDLHVAAGGLAPLTSRAGDDARVVHHQQGSRGAEIE